MSDMKPILFNTAMVRAILEGSKTVTRRVVKPQPPENDPHNVCFDYIENGIAKFGLRNRPRYCIKTPYCPGDILYVRETWSVRENLWNGMDTVIYRADCKEELTDAVKWRPSIHMPKEAARLFLRMTDVRVERLQEITDEQAAAEGCKGWFVATRRDWDKNPDYITEFRWIWDSTIKKPDLPRCGWEANPWCWVIGFERISSEEAQQ